MWKLSAPVGQHIRLHFNNFVTEHNYDVLNIFEYDNYNVLNDLSGNQIPRDIISTTNTLTLKFKSNGLRSESGFEIFYELGTRN